MSPLTRKQEWYKANAEKARAASRDFHQRKQPHVPDGELLRLRLPENRLEALNYGSERRCVCLGCGLICNRLYRHVKACPNESRSSDEYRSHWGLRKRNPLSSNTQQQKDSASKQTEAFKLTIESKRSATLATFAAQRTRVSEARSKGKPIRRGPLRAEALARRHGLGLTRRLRRPEISDAQIEKILALDLPIAEGARRAGLSQTAFYRRAQRRHGWSGKEVKARRSLATKYVFELRQWLISNHASSTVQDVIDRHTDGLRSKSPERFQQFRPFFAHLEAELSVRPKWLDELAESKLARLKNNKGRLILGSAAISLASKIFKRSRATPRSDSVPTQKRAMGPKPTKLALFEKGLELRKAGKSWGVIAKILDSEGFAKNQRAASDRLRMGIEALRKKTPAIPTNP